MLDATSARAYDGTVYTGKKLWNHPLKFDCRVTGLSVLLPGTTTGLRDYGVSGFGGVWRGFVADCPAFSESTLAGMMMLFSVQNPIYHFKRHGRQSR